MFLSRLATFAAAPFLILACRSAQEPMVIEKEAYVAPVEPRERTGRGAMRALRSSERREDLLVDQCEPGQVLRCGTQLPGARLELTAPCRRTPAGNHVPDWAACATPLVLAFDDEPVLFQSPPGEFRIGPFRRTEWVSARTPWLALDKNGNGCVDDEGELFGPAADPYGRAKNGFDTLRSLDANGDGRIDAADHGFHALQLWFDVDQDRVCSPGEMVPLHTLPVLALTVQAASRPRHGAGSYEGESATIELTGPSSWGQRARLVDVYLAPLPSANNELSKPKITP
jgi:hypothetical protein